MHTIIEWFKKLINNIVDMLFAFVLTVLGYAFLLYFFKMLWTLYSETQISDRFRQHDPELFSAMSGIMSQNMLFFSFDIALMALKLCFVIALVCQVFLVKRYLYDSRGLIGKFLIFGLPCSAAVTYYSGVPNAEIYFIFYLIPTFNLMGYCFKFTEGVIS